MEMLRTVVHLAVSEEPLLVRRFYGKLFEQHPEALELFAHTDMGRQEQMLGEMLIAIVDHLDSEKWLEERLVPLGTRHHGYGATPEMYAWVGKALWETVSDVLGEISARRGTPVLEPVEVETLVSQYDVAIGAAAGLMLSGYPASARAGAADSA